MIEDRLLSLSHCFRRTLWPLWDRRTTWAILGLLALVGGLYLWQAGEMTAIRHHIRELEEEHERFRRRNVELQKEISQLTPVAVLTERARSLGFVLPQEEMHLQLSEGELLSGARGRPSD